MSKHFVPFGWPTMYNTVTVCMVITYSKGKDRVRLLVLLVVS